MSTPPAFYLNWPDDYYCIRGHKGSSNGKKSTMERLGGAHLWRGFVLCGQIIGGLAAMYGALQAECTKPPTGCNRLWRTICLYSDCRKYATVAGILRLLGSTNSR